MDRDQSLDRRSLLLASAVLLAGSGCSSAGEEAGSSRRSTTRGPTTQSDPTAASTTHAFRPEPFSRLPPVEAWSASPGDLRPEVKVAAARVVEAIGGWRVRGGGGPAVAAGRVEALGERGGLVRSAGPLLADSDAAGLQVVEAQYGGLLESTASVLVVCRQWFADVRGPVVAAGATVDVRLASDLPRWQVTALHPGIPPAPARPVSRLAKAVLAERRIDLPPAARADVSSGHIHGSVLTAMLRLSHTYRLGVSVLRSGHPRYVFGTDRVSEHTLGRAFDTWQIDGHPVVDPSTSPGLVTGYLLAVARAGAHNVGGPYPMPSGTAQFFTDPTHHDHVHAGFAG